MFIYKYLILFINLIILIILIIIINVHFIRTKYDCLYFSYDCSEIWPESDIFGL